MGLLAGFLRAQQEVAPYAGGLLLAVDAICLAVRFPGDKRMLSPKPPKEEEGVGHRAPSSPPFPRRQRRTWWRRAMRKTLPPMPTCPQGKRGLPEGESASRTSWGTPSAEAFPLGKKGKGKPCLILEGKSAYR